MNGPYDNPLSREYLKEFLEANNGTLSIDNIVNMLDTAWRQGHKDSYDLKTMLEALLLKDEHAPQINPGHGS
jgi:hypothetical protein